MSNSPSSIFFPHITLPSIPENWVDISHKNDISPFFQIKKDKIYVYIHSPQSFTLCHIFKKGNTLETKFTNFQSLLLKIETLN